MIVGCLLSELLNERRKSHPLLAPFVLGAPERGKERFLNQDTTSKYSYIVSHWALLAERPMKLKDFSRFELVTLVQNCRWDKVVAKPHPVYEVIVLEFMRISTAR